MALGHEDLISPGRLAQHKTRIVIIIIIIIIIIITTITSTLNFSPPGP